MKDYYRILGADPGDDRQSIKKHFRQKIKDHHPDLGAQASIAGVMIKEIREAYQVLSCEASRQEYDLVYRLRNRKGSFQYREWLVGREDHQSRARLIFYDIIRERPQDALDLYLSLREDGRFSLEKELDREDFMDCAFLLARMLEDRKDYPLALELYTRIAELETQKDYFRHFFIEVQESLVKVFTASVSRTMSPQAQWEILYRLDCLKPDPFHRTLRAKLSNHMSEICFDLGQASQGLEYLRNALSLNPKDKAIRLNWEKRKNQGLL